jgi:hypothetical protein
MATVFAGEADARACLRCVCLPLVSRPPPRASLGTNFFVPPTDPNGAAPPPRHLQVQTIAICAAMLGKTGQRREDMRAIRAKKAAAKERKGAPGTAPWAVLIVTPTTVVDQWAKELEDWGCVKRPDPRFCAPLPPPARSPARRIHEPCLCVCVLGGGEQVFLVH